MSRHIYIKPRTYKTVSRYKIYRRIVDTSTNDTYLESTNNIEIKGNCVYHKVEPHEANRLDIISNLYYDTPTFYWAIAMANNIIDPLIVVPGTMLKIPSYESLIDMGGPLYNHGNI